MRIATWNVNSVRARMANALEWLGAAKPDIVLLQEIKCETEAFPRLEFEALGYHCHALGQKSYNGVAILSRLPIEDVREGLLGDAGDAQARYLEALIGGVRIASLYVPNGNPVETEKFTYKLAWMERLRVHAAELLRREEALVLGGDYNVIPEALDVYDPAAWEQDALFHPMARAAFRRLEALGLTDIYRALHPDKPHAYTFWDYQAGAWPQDHGLRIDHFLMSPEAVDRVRGCQIDRAPRGQDKASDHTPVVVEI
ncbi:MAG: exodeoxyribonuclease III [Bdellovibrionales bacterium]